MQVTASAGHAGTLQQPLDISAGIAAGSSATLSIEGRDGVFAGTLLNQGAVELRSAGDLAQDLGAVVSAGLPPPAAPAAPASPGTPGEETERRPT